MADPGGADVELEVLATRARAVPLLGAGQMAGTGTANSIVDVDWLAAWGAQMAGAGTPRRPVVAGGSGLLGHNVMALLAKTPGVERIKILDMRPPHREVTESFQDRVDFEEYKFGTDSLKQLVLALEGADCVVSVFTPHVQFATTEEFFITNVNGTETLVEACAEVGCRLVHISSMAVTSFCVSSHNGTEDDLLPGMEDYRSPYDESKRRGENAVLEASKSGRISACVLRLGALLLAPSDFTFSNFFKVPGILVAPSGTKLMDYIDGRDCARAVLLAAQGLVSSPQTVDGEAFYITGQALPTGEVCKMAARFINYPFVFLPRWIMSIVICCFWVCDKTRSCRGGRCPGIPSHQFVGMCFKEKTFDNGKAKRLLGFECKLSHEDSVGRIMHLFMCNGLKPGPGKFKRFVACILLLLAVITTVVLVWCALV